MWRWIWWAGVSAATAYVATVSRDGVQPQPLSRVEMHNVNYHYDASLEIHIRHLQGRLAPSRRGTPPTFDDKHSFSVLIDSAEIATSAGALTALMNQYVFGYAGAPLKKLDVTTDGARLKIAGIVHKGVDVPFEMRAEPAATEDGKIRLHPIGFRVIHLPVEKVMHAVGLHIQDVIKPAGSSGVTVQKDDLILDTSRMLPSPVMKGHVSAVRIDGDRMVEIFGTPPPAAAHSRNYMNFSGGIIRFGKLTMRDADLSLIDAAPQDPFEFSLDRYKDQLVAGYSKTTPSFGLDVFMPDVTKLNRQESQR
jgi:hypothetical protein